MTHLIKKGYQRIGFVTVDLKMIQMQVREKAYKDVQKKEQDNVKHRLTLKLPLDCTAHKEESIQSIISFT
ncbi:hypothetical protein KC218_29080, partial [Mycobacterium tuberculosis]|nr:hypothetical protein [Mycobacterium tuberculosis]